MTKETELKLEALKAENPDWSQRKLAEAAGCSVSAVGRWAIRRQKEEYQLPEGHSLKGVSTLYGPDGEIKQQWVKSQANYEKVKEALEMIGEVLKEDVRGHYQPGEIPRETNPNLCLVYPIADVHLGMYSWSEETGNDYDTQIASRNIFRGMQHLVHAAPPSEECLIANLADFFHADNQENKTARSGHVLDVDTRWAKVLRTGIRAYRQMIELALTKHRKVYVKSGIGNHDDHSIFMLHELMQAYFENEPRVEVMPPISPFAYHKFGATLIGINHGHIKPDRLPLIMAQDMRHEWGHTKHSHWLIGHVHHKSAYEFPGCVVESFRSPAAKDSWTHASGYRADRDMQSIVFHMENGEVARNRISMAQIEGEYDGAA